MRMKKLFFFAAIAAIAVSCAKTSEVNPVSEQAIGFGTWRSTLTKDPAPDPEPEPTHHSPFVTNDSFNVYGYKQAGEEKTTVFNGDVVTLGENGSWNYTSIRFWDRTTDSYTFYAISPAGITSEAPAQTGLFITNDIIFGGTNGDVLVAKEKQVAKAAYGLTVGLDFVPQASLFDLKFKKAKNLQEATLAINSVSIKKIETKGHLSVGSYDGTKKPVGTWTVATPSVKGNYDNTHGKTPVTIGPATTIAAGVGYGTQNSRFLINNLIVMPQALIDSGQELEITYTVTFSGESIQHTRTIPLNKFDDSDVNQEAGREETAQNTGPFITSWEPGKHYTYYITINADFITFNATISDWVDVEAYHYIIN